MSLRVHPLRLLLGLALLHALGVTRDYGGIPLDDLWSWVLAAALCGAAVALVLHLVRLPVLTTGGRR